ncbi:MAG TPA: DUF1326 domain-containing protein [Gemmatimonadales bacterium]|nr:DUF1326 domain-containing protein [Gemmatimonadales bacterium]
MRAPCWHSRHGYCILSNAVGLGTNRGGSMATPAWQVTGQYYETCSCDFVCPCVPGQLAVMPTKGFCTVAMAFQIEHGNYGTVPLDGLGFIVLLWTPEEMGKGNLSVGVIADARANAEQRDAIASIASGSAGGPMAALSALVETFLGVESAPIQFDRTGAKWSVTAGKFVDMAAEGAMGIDPSVTEPIYLDNTGHPAASRFGLARAVKSHVDALGLNWSDTSGKNHGQYAPFSWRSA